MDSYRSGSKMVLLLKRAWPAYVPAAAIRRFKDVDVHKTIPKLFIFMISGARGANKPRPALIRHEKPKKQALLDNSIYVGVSPSLRPTIF